MGFQREVGGTGAPLLPLGPAQRVLSADKNFQITLYLHPANSGIEAPYARAMPLEASPKGHMVQRNAAYWVLKRSSAAEPSALK